MVTDSDNLFIGRKKEQSVFENIVRNSSISQHLLLIIGTGGIGKSMLLEQFRRICERNSVHTLSLRLASQDRKQATEELWQQILAIDSENGPDTQHLSDALAGYDLPLFAIGSVKKEPASTANRGDDKLRQIAERLSLVGENYKVVLLVDVGHATRAEIRELYFLFLERLPKNVLIVLATRHQIPLSIPLHRDFVTYIELHPFSIEETRDYLIAHGIRDQKIIESIWGITKGLPLLVGESLAYSIDGKFESSQFETRAQRLLIERAFEEIKDHFVQDLARLASVMRRFNFEMLRKLTRSQKLQRLMDSLAECSFVETRGSWTYILPQVREGLVYELQTNSPKRFNEITKKILAYYDSLPLNSQNPSDKEMILEKIYHELSLDEKKGIAGAIKCFIKAEQLFQRDFSYSILTELNHYSFHSVAAKHWIKFCEATIARLDHDWSASQTDFEQILADSPSAQVEAYVLEGLAGTLRERGNWNAAEKASQQASEAFDRLNDRDSKLSSLVILGNLFTLQHKWKEALDSLNKALSLASKEGNSLVDFRIYLELADLFRSQGLWTVAHDNMDKAMFKAEQLESKVLQAQVWNSLGKLHRLREDWEIAISNYKRSVELYASMDNPMGQAQSLHSWGVALLRKGQLEEALSLFERSLSIKELIQDKFGVAKSYNGIGHVKRLSGDIVEALEYYQRSAKLFEQVGNETKAGRVLCRIGMTLAKQDQLEEAIKYLEQSRELRLKVSDRQGVAETFYELGLIQEQLGDVPTARESFSLSLRFSSESKSHTRQLAPTVQLAILAYLDRDYNTAEKHLDDARRVVAQSKQYSLLANLYVERASFEANKKRFTGAFLCYAEAVYIAANVGDKFILPILKSSIHLLEGIQFSDGIDLAGEFASRQINFWHNNCKDKPDQQSYIWEILNSPESVAATRDGSAALAYLSQLLKETSKLT